MIVHKYIHIRQTGNGNNKKSVYTLPTFCAGLAKMKMKIFPTKKNEIKEFANITNINKMCRGIHSMLLHNKKKMKSTHKLKKNRQEKAIAQE